MSAADLARSLLGADRVSSEEPSSPPTRVPSPLVELCRRRAVPHVDGVQHDPVVPQFVADLSRPPAAEVERLAIRDDHDQPVPPSGALTRRGLGAILPRLAAFDAT